MKTSTKLLAAASILAGGALGVLFAPDKGNETRKKLNKKLEKLSSSFDGTCGKEKLLMVRDKLEGHRQRLNKHLEKINSLIAERETRASGKRTESAVVKE